MSTRATRSHARKLSTASITSQVAPSKPATISKPRSKSISKPHVSIPVFRKKYSRGKAQDVWCICRRPDDSKPMIRCEHCKDWFHFACIELSERDAEDIQLYVCDGCHSKTGQSTVYDWEGPDAVEEFVDHGLGAVETSGAGDAPAAATDQEPRVEATDTTLIDDLGDEDDEVEQEASGDDYKEDEQHSSVVVRRGRGRTRIMSSDEEEIDDDADDRSPSRRVQLKRKRGKEMHIFQRKRPRKPSPDIGSGDDGGQSERQRKKGNTKAKTKHDSVMDPTRKYCSGKLRDVLLPIFVQFANAPQSSDGDRLEDGSATELDEEQKKRAEEHGATYVQELEQCLFEIYGETERHGQKTAAGKYKDRFRMLSFNLSQPDRHLLRRSIGTHALPALQLSKMSSVDLANEQTKQQIEAANRESLEHSILTQRPIAARAKITHKGEEIIEDLVGDDIGRRIRDEEQREREREREREKGARERAKMPPPPAPALQEPPFKGPQDILAQQHSAASQKAAQAQVQHHHPSTTPSSTEVPQEPSFEFDDLIAIDLPDGSPPQENVPPDPDSRSSTAASHSAEVKPDQSNPSVVSRPQSSTSVTTACTPSFDLNHVWSGAGPENTPQESSGSPILAARMDDARDPPAIEIDLGTAADDEDFDMFLDRPDAAATASLLSGPDAERAAFEALPVVWSGNVNLPDAAKSPAVEARQVGGRYIDFNSIQWHVLFPPRSPQQLKVDGRVPVKESAKYMTQNRMNVTRELIVVALTPSADRTDYDEVISFLVNRDRHAVVHPWGPNPGPDAPGKELYLIPIMPHEALPDYVEILDLVRFPKQRDDKMLLGVFVLNKGKFSERVAPASLQPPMPSVPITRTDITPGIPSGVPSQMMGQPSLAASVTQATQQAPPVPPEIVSKLTPEQLDSLLQNLLSGGINPIPATQPQQPPPQQPMTYPSAFPPSLANLLPPQYPAPSYPAYPPAGAQGPPQYFHPPPHQPLPMPYGYSPPHMSASPPRDSDYRRSPPYGASSGSSGYGRPGRGDFDRPRGRGGGRNFSGNERGRGAHGGDFERPRDSGWGGRGRGRGGHQQTQSPPRQW